MSFILNKFFSKISKKKLFLLLTLLFFGAVLPLQFSSASWNPLTWGDTAAGLITDVLLFLPFVFIYIFYLLSSVFPIITGTLLKWVIDLDILLTRCETPNTCAVDIGWSFTRDLANIFFILFLVIIAFATILKIESYGMKRLLPVLIIVALLINFSQLFVGVIVDFWNALTSFFTSKLTNIDNYYSGVIDTTSQTWGSALSGGIESAWSNIGTVIELLVMGIFNVILGFMLGFYFLIFFMRIPMLWMLTILAPIYFVCAIIPYTKGKFTQWVKWVMEWASIGFWASLYLYLGLFVINSTAAMGLDKMTFNMPAGDITGGLESIVQSVIPYLVAIAFLALGAMTSFQTNTLFSAAIVGGASAAYGKYVSPQAWGRAGKKWGKEKVETASISGGIGKIRGTWGTIKGIPGKTIKGLKSPGGAIRNAYKGEWGKEHQKKIDAKEEEIKDSKSYASDKNIKEELTSRRKEIDKKIDAIEEERAGLSITEDKEERKKLFKEKKELEEERDELDDPKTAKKMAGEIKAERQEEIEKKNQEKEEINKETFRGHIANKLANADIKDISQAIYRQGFSKVPIVSQSELAELFKKYGEYEHSITAAQGEAKNYSSFNLARDVTDGVVKGIRAAAWTRELATRGDSEDLFKVLGKKYNLNDEEISGDVGIKANPKTQAMLENIIRIAYKGGEGNTILRRDPRLAGAMAGTSGSGFNYLNERTPEEAIRKVTREMRHMHIANAEPEVFKNKAVASEFASTKGPEQVRTAIRDVKNFVPNYMNTLNEIFKDFVGKQGEELTNVSEKTANKFREIYGSHFETIKNSYVKGANVTAPKGFPSHLLEKGEPPYKVRITPTIGSRGLGIEKEEREKKKKKEKKRKYGHID